MYNFLKIKNSKLLLCQKSSIVMELGVYTYCVHKATSYLFLLFIDPKQQTKNKGLDETSSKKSTSKNIRIIHDIAFRKKLGITFDAVSQNNLGMRLDQHWCPLLAYPTKIKKKKKEISFSKNENRSKKTFNPFSIKKCLRRVSMSFDFSALDTLQVECLADISIIE